MSYKVTLRRVTSPGATDKLIPEVKITNIESGVGTAGETLHQVATPLGDSGFIIAPVLGYTSLLPSAIRTVFSLAEPDHVHANALNTVFAPQWNSTIAYPRFAYVEWGPIGSSPANTGLLFRWTSTTPTTPSDTPPTIPSSSGNWLYIGSSDSLNLEQMLERKADLVGGKVPVEQFPISNSENMGFKGTTGTLSDDDANPTPLEDLFKSVLNIAYAYNAGSVYNEFDFVYYNSLYYRCKNDAVTGVLPTNTTDWLEMDAEDYEANLRAQIGSFLIVNDEGYVGRDTNGTDNYYQFNSTIFNTIDDEQAGTLNELKLELTDMIVFADFSVHGTNVGYYNLKFTIVNGRHGLASGGVTGTKGLVTISKDITTREGLDNSTYSGKAIDESALKNIMKDFVNIVEIQSLPTGVLTQFHTSSGNLTAGVENDIALVGSATKLVYRYQSSSWVSQGTLINLPGTGVLRTDTIYYDTVNSKYSVPSVGGNFGTFTTGDANEHTTSGDLCFFEQAVIS